MKLEIQNPKFETRSKQKAAAQTVPIRASNFEFVSGFEFRVSDFDRDKGG